MNAQISVARDFSRFPAGATRQDGPYSGQAFYEDILVPLIIQGGYKKIEIILDGTLGYGSSWLCAAFENVDKFTFKNMNFVSTDTSLIKEIKEYVENKKHKKIIVEKDYFQHFLKHAKDLSVEIETDRSTKDTMDCIYSTFACLKDHQKIAIYKIVEYIAEKRQEEMDDAFKKVAEKFGW